MIRIWYWICLLFLVINIDILIEESYGVIYKMVNQNRSFQFLYCLNLNEIIINKTEINSNEIKSSFNYGLKLIHKNRDDYNESILNATIDQVKLNDYFIYQNKICFIFDKENDFKTFHELNEFKLDPIYFLFNNKTLTFFKFKYVYHSEFNQITIHHKEYPYSSCSKDYSNFKCLNDKIKKKQRLSRYYYRSNENISIKLNYQINQTIIDNELKTIKQCNRIDCEINLFDSVHKSESILLESFLCISKLDFYLQLIGLIIFFLNIPIYQFVIKIIDSINLKPLKIKLFIEFIKLIKLIKLEKLKINFNKFKLRLNRIKLLKLLKRKCLKLNYLIMLILLICLSILFSRSIYNFIEERDYPSTKSISINPITSELSIVLCLRIHQVKGEDYNIYNRSYSELEKETNNFLDIVLKDIYLQFSNKKIPTKWQLETKFIVFFAYTRCFQIRIYLDAAKYESIFSEAKLIIELDRNSNIFILIDNELFNSYTYWYDSNFNFKKRILERSRLNQIKKCKNYNLANDNCTSKGNCVDQCTIQKTYNQLKNMTYSSFVEKKYFTDNEWSNLFIKPNSRINFEIYVNISKECDDKYSKFDPCIDIKFEHHSRVIRTDSKYRIDLNYDVIYYKEDESSIFKLLLDLLNIESNLFGLNFNSLLFMILALFKFTNLKLIKIIKLFIYLICSIGFIYHLWSIYDEIINIEIIFSEHYELINTIQTPDLIFCFDINQTKLDSNYKLTYEYLDKITNELREDQIFNRIEYLNETNQWTKLDNRTSFQDNNLKINIFYFLGKKCFKIIQNINYNRNQFEFNKMDDGLIFKLILNREYLNKQIFYFFSKTKNKIQLSKIEEFNLLKYIKFDEFNKLFIFDSFKIKHELIERDEYELIKNPLLTFLSNQDQNDLDKFLNKLINYFVKKLNFVTFELPINKTELNSHKQLDDNLFTQLYNQQRNQINFNTNHLKYSRNYLDFYIHYLKNFDPVLNLIPNFEFSLSFYRKVIVVSNKISLIKLIINLLNVLSFWFNLGILDLHYYLFKIKLFPLQFYKLLIIIKNQLKSFI